MLRKTFTVTIIFLLIASITASAGGGVSFKEGSSAPESIKTRVDRIIKEAQESAIYDDSGHIIKLTVTDLRDRKVPVGLEYDKHDRLQGVAVEDGFRIGILYEKSGQLQGFKLPDGVRLKIKRGSNGEIVGFIKESASASRRGFKPVTNQLFNATQALALDGDPVSDCRVAVAAAAAAALNAAAACAFGSTPQCATAVTIAAVAAANAVNSCRDVMLMENAS